MDIERALVSKIIHSGRLDTAISRGIRDDLFWDDECKDVFRYIREYNQKYNCSPPIPSVKADKPNFDLEHVQEPIDALIDRFISLAKRRYAQQMVAELARACDDPERSKNIDAEFLEVSRKLVGLVPSGETASFTKDMERRISDYEDRSKEGMPKGIPFGFESLDAWTKGGIKRHQLAIVAGFTGTGKSTMLKTVAFNAWMQGYTPLYFSLEEDADEIYERLDAMAAGLDFSDLAHLRLKPQQLENWRKYAKKMRDYIADIPVIEGGRFVTPDVVYAKMVEHKPSIVFIDYISLMKSSSVSDSGNQMWQNLTEISQDLKQIARTMKIPIFAAAQTNRAGGKEGATLDNIGYSLSVGQDADIFIGLYSDEDLQREKEMDISVIKNRRGRLGKFKAIWDHENLIFREKMHKDSFGISGVKEPPPPKPEPEPVSPHSPGVREPAPPPPTPGGEHVARPVPRSRPKPLRRPEVQ